MSSLTLQGKHGVVFGAGGSIGSAVARELASEGAELFLAGRTSASVDEAARQIAVAGGRADPQTLDSLEHAAVDAFVDAVIERAGGGPSLSPSSAMAAPRVAATPWSISRMCSPSCTPSLSAVGWRSPTTSSPSRTAAPRP
jgi:NAD(P)-dependent dehydrogenase (short-subunit alcohol dehydrogenase family)